MRRLSLPLAAVVVLAVAAGAGIYLHLRGRQTSRAAAARREMQRCLDDSAAARERAERDPEAAVDELLAAAAHAERALAVARGGDASDEDVSRAEAATAAARALDAARMDRERRRRASDLLRRLTDVRTLRAGPRDEDAVDEAFAAAFGVAGVDADRMDPSAAAERLRELESAVAIATAIDEWTAVRRRRKGALRDPERLVRLASALDPDPIRVRIRAAFAARDLKALEAIGGDPAAAEQPPATQQLLANILGVTGGAARAASIYERLFRRHPDDLWTCIGYAHWLEALEPPDLEGAARLYTAAITLSPRSARPRLNLSNVLVRLGELSRALEVLDAARQVLPEEPLVPFNQATVLLEQGDAAAAEAAYRTPSRWTRGT